MKKLLLPFITSLFLLLTGCSQKPAHHPKHPNYGIIKPKIKYTPSKKNLAKMVKKLQGSPYVWAEEGPDKFDCSGFTYYLYGSMGIEIPRVARNQAKVGKRVAPHELQYGDLIFFATNKKSARRITHVGMYLGNGWFTHASTVKHEVIYSNLFTSPYYKRKLRICRRYLPDASVPLAKKITPTLKKSTLPAPWKATKVPSIKKSKSLEERKAIVIKAPLKDIEQSSADGNFYVQVGSFVGHPKSSLIYTITRAGLKHKVIQFSNGSQQISKLLIGPYVKRSQALSVLPHVRKHIQKNAFIAEIR